MSSFVTFQCEIRNRSKALKTSQKWREERGENLWEQLQAFSFPLSPPLCPLYPLPSPSPPTPPIFLLLPFVPHTFARLARSRQRSGNDCEALKYVVMSFKNVRPTSPACHALKSLNIRLCFLPLSGRPVRP